MTFNIKKPFFIVFEGIDGSGKSTQADMLYDFLKSSGTDTVKLVEPTDGEWGRKIRETLKGNVVPPVEEMTELFILDRREDVEKNIVPALKSNKVIVMDRYFFSTAAYQGAMGDDPDRIIKKNIESGFPVPDRVYFIDIDPALAMERIDRRNQKGEKEIFEKKAFLKRVRELYSSMADPSFLKIDGALDKGEILKIIKKDLLDH